jgi:hypothetical protein
MRLLRQAPKYAASGLMYDLADKQSPHPVKRDGLASSCSLKHSYSI